MTLKYTGFRKYTHDYNSEIPYFSIIGGELYGQKLSPHKHRSEHNRIVYLSDDYVLKIDNPFINDYSYLKKYVQQSKKEYKAYSKLSKKQKEFVPKLVEFGQIYIPIFEGAWAWYIVTERVRGQHPRHSSWVSGRLERLFESVTQDLHEFNVIEDKEGKQWLVDLGF